MELKLLSPSLFFLFTFNLISFPSNEFSLLYKSKTKILAIVNSKEINIATIVYFAKIEI